MAAAKSENGDVSDSDSGSGVIDYTAHLPPPPPYSGSSEKPGALAATSSGSSSTLIPAQTAMHKKMLEHFQSESYKIPGVDDGELLEVEKFWLVRAIYFTFFRVWVLISNLLVGLVFL